MAVLDIRGTNGAGKSWIVHQLLAKYRHGPIAAATIKAPTIGYHIHKFDCAVVGKYTTDCGGCDTIKTADAIEERVRMFAKLYENVVLEGITVAHTFGRYNKLALDLGNKDYYFLFLTTPLAVCISRVRARRKAKGNTKTFNPDKPLGLTSDYGRVLAAKRNLTNAGRQIIELDYRNPLPQVLELLNG